MAAAFRGDDIGGAVDAWVAEIHRRADLAMREVMAALEGWAKSEHGHPGESVTRGASGLKGNRDRNPPHEPPFWDLTGDTTRSIKGEVVEISQAMVRGVLTAGMDYDVFLELAHNGKWAFLWPTVMNHKDEIKQMIAKRMAEG